MYVWYAEHSSEAIAGILCLVYLYHKTKTKSKPQQYIRTQTAANANWNLSRFQITSKPSDAIIEQWKRNRPIEHGDMTQSVDTMRKVLRS